MAVKLTRVRLEGTGSTAVLLREHLIDAWERARGETHGEWVIEDEGFIPNAQEGVWGRLTIRAKVIGSDDATID